MHVVAVASQKGGSGKTTLAGHLAVAADRAGMRPVVLVDTDPQGSLSDWWNERERDTPLLARTAPCSIADDLDRMRTLGMRVVIVDTPPAIEATIVDVAREADLVLIPARPSPHDLRAAGATVALLQRLDKPYLFVLNAAMPRTRITNEAVLALAQHGAIAPVVVHHRTCFAASMIDGRTVMEIPDDGRSGAEIAALWTHVAERLAAGGGCAPGDHANALLPGAA